MLRRHFVYGVPPRTPAAYRPFRILALPKYPGPAGPLMRTEAYGTEKREVFAADFRDRVVHHLYYNYIYKWIVRTFIVDTYSCIEGRGTLYGIRRLEQHIRKESLVTPDPALCSRWTSRDTSCRMDGKISLLKSSLSAPDAVHLRSSLSSMMGLMRQHRSFNLRWHLAQTRLRPFLEYGHFDAELTKFIPDAE